MEKVSEILIGTILFAAIPYFTGFLYLQSYFDFFGIEINELNISTEYIFSSSFFAAKSVYQAVLSGNISLSIWIPLSLSLLLALIFGAILLLSTAITGYKPFAVTFCTLAIIFCLFAVHTAGEFAAERKLSSSTRVLLTEFSEFKENSSDLNEVNHAIRDSSYVLVHVDKDMYYIVKHPKRSHTEEKSKWLLRLPRKDGQILISRHAM